jgi:hypothetical protein
MTTPGPAAGLDRSRIDMNRFQAEYAAMEATLPTTADQAAQQAREHYIVANLNLKVAKQHTFRFRKRRKLVDLATLALSAAQWLQQEEQRLRLAEERRAPRVPATRVDPEQAKAYRAYMHALKQWYGQLDALFNGDGTIKDDLKRPTERMGPSERDTQTRNDIRAAHDAAVAALTDVELVGTARVVRAGRAVYETLYESCSILLDSQYVPMPIQKRKEILRSADLRGLIAQIRAELGADGLGEQDGVPARFAR